MSTSERKVLQRLKSMLEQCVKVHQIILFGSRARGDADAESDMDVLVVLDQPINRETRKAVSGCTWQVGFNAGMVVTAILFARDEWENGPEYYSPLAEAVRKEGVLI